MANTPAKFHFKGRYTLRGINGTWQIYDRELECIAQGSPSEHTFTKAEKMLMKWKMETGKWDVVIKIGCCHIYCEKCPTICCQCGRELV
jgi:hypothetical protein